MFRNRFLALRRADRLGEAEHARLEALLAVYAELARAWAMLQEVHGLYLAEDEEPAMAALDRFSRMYQDDLLPEFYRWSTRCSSGLPRCSLSRQSPISAINVAPRMVAQRGRERKIYDSGQIQASAIVVLRESAKRSSCWSASS